MQDDHSIDSLSFATPSVPRRTNYFTATTGAYASGIRSTPASWMTDQRKRRMGKRGYGKRGSSVNSRSELNFGGMDDAKTSDSTGEGGNRLFELNTDSNVDDVKHESESESNRNEESSRYPRRNRSRSMRSASPDLNSSMEEQQVVKKAKKKRTNVSTSRGRPPLHGRSATTEDVGNGAYMSSNASEDGTTDGLNSGAKDAEVSTPFILNEGTIASRTRRGTPALLRSYSVNNVGGGNTLDFSSAAQTPAANTRRRAYQRSQSVEVNSTAGANTAASAAKYLEENVHPNDSSEGDNAKPPAKTMTSNTDSRRTRTTKKRTASITGIDVKASPPKMANRKTTTSSSFSSTSFSSSGSGLEESFSNLAKKRDTPSFWGHQRSYSQSSFAKTPMEHCRSSTFGSMDKNTINGQSMFLSPSIEEEGRMLRTPMVVGSERKEGFASLVEGSTPICELSPPSASSLFASPDGSVGNMDIVRDVEESDNESMSSCDEDSVHSSSSDESVPDEPTRQLTDGEIFDSKSSYDDFKFLLKTMIQWSKTTNKHGKVASMGLNNGCQIAVPHHWSHVRKSNFIRWASVSCGFRVGNAGRGLSILRCVESKGLEILGTLKRILEDHKAGRLAVVDEKKEEMDVDLLSPGLVSAPRLEMKATHKDSKLQLKAPSAFPFCDDNDEDEELAESFEKQVNIDKPKKNNGPSLRRSILLQPLARAMRSPLPMMSRRLRLSTDSHDTQLTIDSDRKVARLPPPRLSTESAMSGSDFLSQINCAGPLSPIADFLPKMRQRAGRMLKPKRPSLERPRLSFESSTRSGKPYESPHPNNNCAVQNTPLPRADFGCDRPWETPMPKQVEHWGSQPIAGRDWGDSVCCDRTTLKGCKQVFAQSWFQSEFNNNEAMCDSYKMSFPHDEQASLNECYNSDSDTEIGEDYDEFDLSPEAPPIRQFKLKRGDSVGGSAFALLQLNDVKETKRQPAGNRRSLKLRKYRRMSLCAVASDFVHPKLSLRHLNSPRKPDASLTNQIVSDGPILANILSFFNQKELLQTCTLVSTEWADAAAESLGDLMIASVGCDPSIISSPSNDDADDELDTPRDDIESMAEQGNTHISSAVARSMEREWSYFANFATGTFLSEGAFKKVFKVFNKHLGFYEALSVMDVDAISESGNLHTVGAELAVSSLLSSMARRAISPNFVITRGVFTCQYDLPTTDWDEAEDYGEALCSANNLEQGECGNFQYIRMELCKHGDAEEYMRRLPDKMLSPCDCRHLLFQMAFALHVAGDRLGLKHYDVKLLNWFLQSAVDDAVPEDKHQNVVLRYGVGSSIFRLRMKSSTALIVKLADYGTSVLRSDSDGLPISIGQFTTFENTPPDYLILGNDAKQGYGHDCFGLGLSMLHLFTGHCPYEEILKDVVCPDTLKKKLRKIWKSATHDIICSAMMYEDSDGNDVEDETFYDTLYRFIVLFGMPKRKLKYEGAGKVRKAINSTLFKEGTPDSILYQSDRLSYSLADGSNQIIATARRRLEEMDGAMDLLLSLVCFDPSKRATPLDVINSRFMIGLVETSEDATGDDNDIVRSYMAYLTNK